MSGARPLREVRQLAANAAGAEDAALLRLVRLLDGLQERGEADHVLDAARARLRALKPQRPIRFARLLFLPLDGAIVPPPRWRRGGFEIPRSALSPIATAVEAALGLAAAAINRDAQAHGLDDAAMVAALGARLWPAAADALPASAPPGWSDSGLAPEDYAAIRQVIAPVLGAGPPIFAALRVAEQGPPAEQARLALIGPAEAGPLPLAAALATLLQRAAAPGSLLRIAAEFGPAARALAGRMAALAIEMLPDPATTPLHEAARSAGHSFRAMNDLAESGLLDAEGTRRLLARRHAAEEACRRRVTEAGNSQVVGALAALRQAGAVDDAALAEVERDARAVRALAQAGRAAGDPALLDRALRQISNGVAALSAGPVTPGGLSAVDLARVVEILDGPAAAAALLARRPSR